MRPAGTQRNATPAERRPAARVKPVGLPDRLSRLKALCKMWSAPAALADEMHARGVRVDQAWALLDRATGNAQHITPAGVASIRMAMVRLDLLKERP